MRAAFSCLTAAVAAAVLAACGGGAAKDPAAASAAAAAPWIDPKGEEPLVGSIAVDPADGRVFLTTNRGLYRVREGQKPERIQGRLTVPGGGGPVSEQLVVGFAGPEEMLGSGHPPPDAGLPEMLGLMRSTDGGRTWASVSELGGADFHVLERAQDVLIGGLYGEAQVLVSNNGGRLWTTRVAPGPTTDLAADPNDGSRWVAGTTNGLFTSDDEGRSWRQRDPVVGCYLAWPATEALYRADTGGAVLRSGDGGLTWEAAGELGGEPAALTAAGPEDLYAALADGTVTRSRDGGRTWSPVVEP